MSKVAALEIKYEDRLLGFLDVLGWAALLKESEADPTVLTPISEALQLMVISADWPRAGEPMAEGTERLRRSVVATQFSDTFVVSAPADEAHATAVVAVMNALAYQLLLRGRLCRGAIVRGKLHHDGKVILGPALVEAHVIESEVAKYPRIVVTSPAEELFRRLEFDEGGFVRGDNDGLRHFDYLNQAGTPALQVASERARVRSWAVAEGEKFQQTKPDHFAKYEWLTSYIDNVASGKAGGP